MPAIDRPALVSHFELDEQLGSGGVAVVYRASDKRLGRRVALKFLRPALLEDPVMRQRLLSEARAAASLDHPNICTIFEVGETDGGEVFIAMAFYDGETLDQAIGRGPLDVRRAISIAMQIGRGLAAAHEELIIHRDIKPSNVMLIRGDTVKILDFGLAKLAPEIHRAGVIDGTPAYMSPEQVRGEPVDQRTDIWSAGVVLYEMLTGTRPFLADTFDHAVNSILHDQPPAPSSVRRDLPSAVDRIIARALAKNARFRYERITDMMSALQELQSEIDSAVITMHRRAASARSSLAVLPFQDMSSEQNQGYLCDGIAEEVLRALSSIPDLYVASRTSAWQFKNRAADVRDIGARLNVDSVLEGSVRRAGNRVRVSAQLVSVADGYRLWYERYDRDIQDIFDIEDEIADQIARALQVTLLEKGSPLSASASQTNSEAYELYLQGREFFHQHRRKSYEGAIQTFSRAIGIDPGFARAHAGLADCHAFLRLYFGAGEEAVRAADAASARALELEPDLPEARTSRGLALFVQGRLAEAETELRRAIELDPRSYEAHYVFARVAFSEGRIPEAASQYREACALVPEAYDSWYLLGMCYRRMNDPGRARSADIESIEAAQRRLRVHPDDSRAWTMGAAVLAEVGEPERALDWVDRAVILDPDESIIRYNAACVYCRLGKLDTALDCLAVMAEHGAISREWVLNDPDLDALRDHPRFLALLEKGAALAPEAAKATT